MQSNGMLSTKELKVGETYKQRSHRHATGFDACKTLTRKHFTTGKNAADSFTTSLTNHYSKDASRVAAIAVSLDDGGGGHPETTIFLHLTIPISLHVFQAVRNERAPWLNGQMTCLKVQWSQVQIPRVPLRKKNRKTGIAQRQSVYNIVGHILDSCET